MKIQRATLETCATASGLVVAIDVLRAFSTAAYAFAAGVREILLVSAVEEAFQLRQSYPDYLIMGEESGLPVPGFDFSNSPTELIAYQINGSYDLYGRGMIQRTSAGTQGIVLSRQAHGLLATSFVVASATAKLIRQLNPESLTFVITGTNSRSRFFPNARGQASPGSANINGVRGSYKTGGDDEVYFGDEDAACADYIEALLAGLSPNPAAYIRRVIDSGPGRIFSDPGRPEFPASDLELCTDIDRFDFTLRVQRRAETYIMTAYRPS